MDALQYADLSSAYVSISRAVDYSWDEWTVRTPDASRYEGIRDMNFRHHYEGPPLPMDIAVLVRAPVGIDFGLVKGWGSDFAGRGRGSLVDGCRYFLKIL